MSGIGAWYRQFKASTSTSILTKYRHRYWYRYRCIPSLCLSPYGSAERLSEYQKTVPANTYWPTCLGRLRATLQLCWIAFQCKASPDELYSSCKSAAAQTQQEVCRLIRRGDRISM